MFDAPTLDDEPLTVEDAARAFAVDRSVRKFRVPKTRAALVRRTELLGRLDRERARSLVLVSAPAGYGKTTLLTQWAQQAGRAFAWVTLDEADAQPSVLADSIAKAMSSLEILPGVKQRFVLVLDDADLIPPDVLRDALLRALDWLPEASQIAIASRRELDLKVGWMRAERMLVEVGTDDLSMTGVEAAALVRGTGVELDFTSVQTLVARTEGWPAALELVASACAQRTGLAADLEQVTGDDYSISEYFRAELLASLSPATIRFLTRTSVLERLSGALCDHVLERSRSASVLAELSRANLPLQAADPKHEWFRLHGLFREMLETELRRSDPKLRLVLHRRASDWYCSTGDPDRAIDHSRSAEDFERAGELLWANLPRYLGGGDNSRVQRWLSEVTAARLAASPALALAAAHSHLAKGQVAIAERWARTAAVGLASTPGGATESQLAGVLIVEAWATRSGATEMGGAAERAYELLPDDSPWGASSCFLRGTAALLGDERAAAEQWLEEGAARGAVVAPDAASLCLAQLGVLAIDAGDSEYGSDLARRARALVDTHGLREYPASALVSAVCASAAMRAGRVDEAKAEFGESLGQLEPLDGSAAWFGAEVRILLARVSLALGEVAGARELLAEASRAARRAHDAPVFKRWFDAAWHQFDARAEGALAGVGALTTAELRVLRFLPTHYSFHEIAQRLHVSSNTVKTHVHAVYRKLDACSRSEAVAHATRAGLIG